MPITGNLLISGSWQPGEAGNFQANEPSSGNALTTKHTKASEAQVACAAQFASNSFQRFRNTSLEERARFLTECAEQIAALGDELLDTMQRESGYPLSRCETERARTIAQLNMFAEYIIKGEYLEPRIDSAQPERSPSPRPDLRSINHPLGVVAVFAVSNFPLAYSSAGGDTASALAAGCPVIVKGHASHPGTGELVAQALAIAAENTGMPPGVFSFILGDDDLAGRTLIEAPGIKAIGFTGSAKGGMAISRLAAARAEPIPVFAEMGSINPVILLPQALQNCAEEIAQGFTASLTLGTGQYCVNPGLIVALEDANLNRFIASCANALEATPAGIMLNANICANYASGLKRLQNHPDIQCVAKGKDIDETSGYYGAAALFSVNAVDFINDSELLEEVFGPASLLVRCDSIAQIKRVLETLNGQLTGTIHGSDQELQQHQDIIESLLQKVGRLVINGFPTGVEVCSATVHGGPFPASSDARFTSVGTAAIKRFVRPVCYQNVPDVLLPTALQNANPLGLMRTVNGEKTEAAIQ